MGVLSEVNLNKKRKRYTRIIIFVVFLFVVVSFYYYNKHTNVVIDYKVANVSTKDIVSTLSNDGKVYYKDQYDLNFKIAGVLNNIYKKEGDEVKKGEVIASLDDKYLKIDVEKASIALETANANLKAKQATKGQKTDINIYQEQLNSSLVSYDSVLQQGDKEIEIAKLNLDTVKLSLSNLKQTIIQDIDNANKTVEARQKDLDNANDNYSNSIETYSLQLKNSQEKLVTEMDIVNPLIDKYLRDIDVLLGITDLNKSFNDGFENFLGAKKSSTKSSVIATYNTISSLYKKFIDDYGIYKNNLDYNNVLNYSLRQLELLNDLNLLYEQTKDMLKNSIASSPNFTQTIIDSYILNMDSGISGIKNEIQGLTILEQGVDSSKLLYDTNLVTYANLIKTAEIQLEQSKISLQKIKEQSKTNLDDITQKYNQAKLNLNTVETTVLNNKEIANSQVQVSKANLENKVVSFDERELEPYYTAIKNAKKTLDEANLRLQDAYLYSPIDGKIGKLSITNVGTNILVNPVTPFVVIINKNSLYIESKVEEGDIGKVFLGQNVKIAFNSIDGLVLTGKVSYISDKADIDTNGIVTYKVEILFDKLDDRVKEGFTSQLAFIIDERKNILSLPLETVKTENGESSVTMLDDSIKVVQTGIDDGDNIEIISGLKLGDSVKY
ncbi:MAG: efflux RND transporter periplasmic adaptor subunit [Candidatus Gracilibacteria bacterium]|nr:efflux RND transporter periplasmic adaptor subunit [Candidatus Gracilibacteria bacterium]